MRRQSQLPFMVDATKPRGPLKYYGIAQVERSADANTIYFKGYYDGFVDRDECACAAGWRAP